MSLLNTLGPLEDSSPVCNQSTCPSLEKNSPLFRLASHLHFLGWGSKSSSNIDWNYTKYEPTRFPNMGLPSNKKAGTGRHLLGKTGSEEER